MSTVKIQGNLQTCLDLLQKHANTNNVTYIAYFTEPSNSQYKISPQSKSQNQIFIYFHWNYTYKEYDNSM